MGKIRKITSIIDIVVFAATTLAIAGVFYEGMTLKWYDFVGILVICMDYSFMPATILHLIADRSNKQRAVHLFSLLLVIAAVVMKILGIPYPPLTLVFWYFYIWFLYGSLIIRRHVCAPRSA
jgi:hypothetical protein